MLGKSFSKTAARFSILFLHQDGHTDGDGHDQKHKQQGQEIQKPFTRIHSDKEHKQSRDQQNGRDIPGQNIERI